MTMRTLHALLRSWASGMGGEMFLDPGETALAYRLRVRAARDTDRDALRGDWLAIGRDFRASLGKIQAEITARRG